MLYRSFARLIAVIIVALLSAMSVDAFAQTSAAASFFSACRLGIVE